MPIKKGDLLERQKEGGDLFWKNPEQYKQRVRKRIDNALEENWMPGEIVKVRAFGGDRSVVEDVVNEYKTAGWSVDVINYKAEDIICLS